MRKFFGSGAALAVVFCSSALAGLPYSPVPVVGDPVLGPKVMPPQVVYGKEYSNDVDYSTATGMVDPQQVVNWDGTGGTMDGIDYSGTRFNWEQDQQVDALANSRDALFRQLFRDESHLVYSHDDEIAIFPAGLPSPYVPVVMPSTGPVTLTSGQVIGGPGEISVERSGAFAGPNIHELWAKAPLIDGKLPPRDVDGLELWGPEPTEKGDEQDTFLGDADKYSLEYDAPSGVSIWNASGSAYLSHSMIVTAVESLLGPIPPSARLPHVEDQEGRGLIDVDALMVYDTAGEIDVFDLEPMPPQGETLTDQLGRLDFSNQEPRDTIIFSIRQIVDEMDPTGDGYYATGSELFVLDSLTGVSFLEHGGHVWDSGYAMSELSFKMEGDQGEQFGVLDINAIETVGEALVSHCPGDFNGDGTVDIADYTVWRNNLGSADESVLSFNGYTDGVVDAGDYHLWKANFGNVCASPMMASMTSSVPEPGTLWMLGAAVTVGVVAARRRKA